MSFGPTRASISASSAAVRARSLSDRSGKRPKGCIPTPATTTSSAIAAAGLEARPDREAIDLAVGVARDLRPEDDPLRRADAEAWLGEREQLVSLHARAQRRPHHRDRKSV